ncbi:hypothetical protein [Shewanella sp.]|uniref:hypothetical protein n=1 Tax=Shewanella sp. TaxID=50422 RepID=UPI003A96D9AF
MTQYAIDLLAYVVCHLSVPSRVRAEREIAAEAYLDHAIGSDWRSRITAPAVGECIITEVKGD